MLGVRGYKEEGKGKDANRRTEGRRDECGNDIVFY